MNPNPNKINTAIDLTITKITVAPNIKRTVSDIQIGNSGHRIIYTQINTIKSPPYQRFIYRVCELNLTPGLWVCISGLS